MTKKITLQDLKNTTNPFWIETKIKGEKWLETKLSSFTGKRISLFGDTAVSFVVGKNNIVVCDINKLSVRVKQWNKNTMSEELIKVIF
tara:strand:- start:10 stop:273 length:264 start_codon:yes stop_codon:yes gene_type:complete